MSLEVTSRHLERPCLRPVEAIQDPDNGRVILRDPTQLASGLLVVGMTEFMLLTLLDGTRRRTQIQADYNRKIGRILFSHELDEVLAQLDAAGFLSGPGFEAYYQGLVREYRSAPYRALRDRDGFGAPADELPALLDEMLNEAEEKLPALPAGEDGGRLAGIVAPHLDFPRGRPCYGAAYAALRRALRETPVRRAVVLGTNHFGRSRSVSATGKDFETPWGVLRNDAPFLERLEAASGGDLHLHELDHLREHSVELQAVWLHHVLGPDVKIVPVLCPDPSGPRGTGPGDPGGADVRRFAHALGRLVREDPEPTLLVASADLSHVGGYFGDERPVDAGRMREVRRADEAGLAHVTRNEPEAYRAHMAATGNPTRVCSVGCLYTLMTALGPEARAHRLGYHQAVTAEIDNAVTCAAYAFHA